MGIFDVDRQVIVLALARMMDSIGNSFLAIVLPLYIASNAVGGSTFGLSVHLITGIIIAAFGLLNSVVQPFLGQLSDRLGKRKVFIVAGLAVLAVTNFAYSLADSYATLFVVRAFQGLGVALTIPGTIALVNELADDATRGGSMGAFNTFRLLGFGIGPIAAGSLVSQGPYSLSLAGSVLEISGFEAAFYIAAIGVVVSLALVSVLISDPETTHAEAGDDLSISVLSRDSEHLLDPVFALGIASAFMAVGIAFFSTIQTDVNAMLNQGATLFGIEFGAFILSQVLLQTPIGTASDRYGRKQFIVWGLILLVPATFVQGLVTVPWQMIGARAIQGVASAMVFAPALALAGDLAGEGQSGTQLSVLTMAFGLGSAIGPLSSGYLIGFGYIWPFVFAASLAALGAIIVFTQVEETVPRDRSQQVGTPQPTADDD